jgi:hypothetical protein
VRRAKIDGGEHEIKELRRSKKTQPVAVPTRDETPISSRKPNRCGQANHHVYGADNVWRQLKCERSTVTRCTVERLMQPIGFKFGRRVKRVNTTGPQGTLSNGSS